MSINYKTTSAITLQHEIRKLGRDLIGVELGVWYGVNMGHLLEECPNIKTLYGIDSYKPYQDWNRYIDTQAMEQAKNSAQKIATEFGSKCSLLITNSEEGSRFFNTIDFVFIDGDHSFEACYNDLNIWYEKVKPKGLFSGHDFSLTGVNKALSKFRKERNIYSNFHVIPNDVWYWIKD